MVISIKTCLRLPDSTNFCLNPVRNRKAQNLDVCFDFGSDPACVNKLWGVLDLFVNHLWCLSPLYKGPSSHNLSSHHLQVNTFNLFSLYGLGLRCIAYRLIGHQISTLSG
uniref:Uncharacterized protein n=1 Tax=Helianthus annuus TaxID=4232 RepID=A0A251ULA2_HELAN